MLEIAPGGGWKTDTLAPYLPGSGQLYEAQELSAAADLTAEDYATDAAYRDKRALRRCMTSSSSHAARGVRFMGFDASGRFDRACTLQNIHSWIKGGSGCESTGIV